MVKQAPQAHIAKSVKLRPSEMLVHLKSVGKSLSSQNLHSYTMVWFETILDVHCSDISENVCCLQYMIGLCYLGLLWAEQ